MLSSDRHKLKKILLIEDDPQVCSFVRKGLTEQNFSVEVCLNGATGLERINSGNYDVVLLDIMLPDISGLEVCSRVREQNVNVPIILLTALGTAENVALGLNMGADDYIVKPFKFIELVARIKSLLRRFERQEPEPQIHGFLDIEMNDETKEVRRNGELISLTSTEYRLLMMFIDNPKRVLSRADILETVWGSEFDLGTNVVDVYINYLRKKLEKNGDSRVIHTVFGMGYVMKEEP